MGILDFKALRPGQGGRIDLDFLTYGLCGDGVRMAQTLQITLIDDFAAPRPSQRPQLYDMVGQSHHLAAMLYHQHIVVTVPQLHQQTANPICVSRMQASGGFVKNISDVA